MDLLWKEKLKSSPSLFQTKVNKPSSWMEQLMEIQALLALEVSFSIPEKFR